MSATIKKSILKKNPKSSIQEAINAVKQQQEPNSNESLDERCIDPLSPKRNGEWTTVQRKEKKKNQTEVEVAETITFPIKLPEPKTYKNKNNRNH